MSQDRDKDEMDRSFWAASILSILSLILSIISILDEDPMFFGLLLIPFFGFGFYAFWKRDKKKKASYYRILENEKREARKLLSGRSKRRFSRNKKVGAVVSVVSLILSLVFFADEDFLLFALFFIIFVSSALVSLIAGTYLDNPLAYFREQNLRNRPASPHRYQGNAHKYLLVTTIVSFGIFIVLEDTLSFENMIDWWISAIIGGIGLMGFFLTMAAWPRKHV